MATKVDQQTKNLILKAYVQDNVSMHSLALQFDRDDKTIVRILRDQNIPIRDIKTQLNLNNAFTPEQEQQICELYNTLPIKIIAKIFEKDDKTIRKILIKHNLRIKTLGEQKTQFTNINAFSDIDTHEKAYWLGFITADGSITESGQLKLQLAEKDKDHLIKFYNFMGSTSKIGTRITNLNNKSYIGYCVTFKAIQLQSDLLRHGVIPNKSNMLQLSDYVSEEYYASYILGIFDGDGCFCFSKNKLSFSIASSLSSCQVIQQFLINKCGVNKTKISLNGNSLVNYVIKYGGHNSIDRIIKLLYAHSPIYLERKYNKYLQYLEYKNNRDIR